jgi:hypothetical protein
MTVSEAFNKFKSNLELAPTFQDTITTNHKAVRDWIESFDSSISTKLIGSLQRKTRIQPRQDYTFDIDILIVLGCFDRWVPSGQGITPESTLRKLQAIVENHGTYQKLGPENDCPTICYEYANKVKVELVPAYLDQIGDIHPKGRGYYIPINNRWVLADYDYDAEYLSSLNGICKGHLIPAIKMLKAAKRHLFPLMRSYHLEVMAVEILPSFIQRIIAANLPVSYPVLISFFFDIASNKIMSSSAIPGSKTQDASTYLSSPEKVALSEMFSKIKEICGSILYQDNASCVKTWKLIFGSPFPGE